ncbi:MAG: hypothetical protein AAF573_19405 [Bacteroidota bacterium]
MSTYDMLINQGMEKGEQKEKARIIKNLLTKFPDHSDDEISDMAGVSSEFVATVRSKIKD